MKPTVKKIDTIYHQVVAATPLPETPALNALPHILLALGWDKSPKLLTQYLSQFQHFDFYELKLLLKWMGYYLTEVTDKSGQALLKVTDDDIRLTDDINEANYSVYSQYTIFF